MRPKRTIDDVVTWTGSSFPQLASAIEVERDWVWLADVNLSGEQNKAIREALKAGGYRWAKRGHPLPSGKTGVWANACEHPTRFARKGSKSGGAAGESGDPAPCSGESILEAKLAALNDL